ncbi:lipid storage droplets surface-binding protein 2 [Halyomorpha halys]|uniref:lipid storage droplets surface-binding protein 2 n=1 Tax=Halyomorpha halys TaxID=286706 RepID=UPI0006D4F119|nr:lipid storage droplets surface-binding protein 2-like [Halyomorpha halys]
MSVDVQMPQIHVIGKLKEIPLVECAYNTSSDVYKKVKESNGLLTWTLQSAEGAFMTALEAVAPVANKFQQPIQVVDDTLCKGLVVLQEKVPIVKEPPAQIVETAKTKVSQISASTVEHVHTITNKGWDKANQVLSSTHYGNVALSGLDSASTTADRYIDYYLPAVEGEENIHPHPSSECEDKVLHTVHTVGTLSSKVGRRVYNRVARPLAQEPQEMSEIRPKNE